MLGVWHCTLVRGDPWTDAEKTGADVMDSHDAVWVFWLINVVYIVVVSPIGERNSRLALLADRGRCCLVSCAGVVRAGMIKGLD